jgi:hypothetical protein
MWQVRAHLPKVWFDNWELLSILLRVKNFPKMIVRVTESETDTRLTNVIHVEFRVNWGYDGH